LKLECQTCETTNESERREPGKKAEGEARASRAEKGRWVELEKQEVAGPREGRKRGGIFKMMVGQDNDCGTDRAVPTGSVEP
jgi:hypothetical protein